MRSSALREPLIIGAPKSRWMIGLMAPPIKAIVLSWFVTQNLSMVLTSGSKDDLNLMAKLLEAGTIKPVIDRCYRLTEVPEAIQYVEAGHPRKSDNNPRTGSQARVSTNPPLTRPFKKSQDSSFRVCPRSRRSRTSKAPAFCGFLW